MQAGVSNQKVIVRNIDMPEMTEEELRGAIEYQAQDYIPIPVEDAVLDFQILGRRTDAEGAARQEVLLVAAQTRHDRHAAHLAQAGWPEGRRGGRVQLGAGQGPRPVSRAPLWRAAQTGVCRGLVDISSSVSTLVVAVDDALKFTRVVNFSSDRFAKAICRTARDSFRGRCHVGAVCRPAGPLAPEGDVYSPEVVADTQHAVQESCGRTGG